ncbi:MAG: 50S ribosomal protein L9 [Candidatus Gracilibacteria bacterium]|nr:50S ribosomal protein L9 [Candidatus Gracilibacteria bacterium]
MKVLFLQNVLHVAKAGEIKEVKPGYAANMLFPKKLAVELTSEVEKQMKDKQKKDDAHRRELLENRHDIADSLTGQKLSFKLKGSKDKVYGAIGEKDIIGEIKKKFKIELSKKHIDMPDGHIKKLGETFIYIKLGKDAMAKMIVVVESDN